MDVLFVNPNSSTKNYQGLANLYSAIEPPTWSLLLAAALRKKGFGVGILDCDAERLDTLQAVERIRDANPRLVCFVTYGQNPNSGTTNMIGTLELAKSLKEIYNFPTMSIGSHTSALPHEVLNTGYFDFVAINEGMRTLVQLLSTDLKTDLHLVKGLGYLENGKPRVNNGVGTIIPTSLMDEEYPGYAWDLLPYKNKPLDLYRSHFWHTNYEHEKRSPFAAIYTSLGCAMKCSFCLSGNTKVILAFHKNKLIKDITIGDEVLSWDVDKLGITHSRVTKIASRTTDTLYKIKLSDGKIIEATGEHPFYIEGVWKNASQLRVGDKCLVIDGADKAAYRMKHKNPMKNAQIKDKVSKTYRNLIKSGKLVPYLCTKKGKKQISEIARKKMLSSENPAYKPENREKAGARFRGANNPRWNNGSCAHLKPYYLGVARNARRAAKKRDNHTCQECGTQTSKNKTHTHHIDYNKYNNQESNLITLCISCHMKTNSNREFWQKRYTQMMLDKSISCPHHVMIENITILKGEFKVYNFQCESNNNFFANQILTHNCMINILNRESEQEGTHAAHSNQMRFWSPSWAFNVVKDLVENYGVETLRFSDEMFTLNKKYYVPLLEKIVEAGYGERLRTWAYARVDTIIPKNLDLMRRSGIRYLGIGIESADQKIRQEIDKGRFREVNIRGVREELRSHDINGGLNYIFGFPNENYAELEETRSLMFELMGEFTNIYCASALPGSPLYFTALENNWELPQTLDGYGFYSYNHVPLRTHHLTAAEVLKFRDETWKAYYTNPTYLSFIEKKFGKVARSNIEDQTKIQLKRRLLGD